MAGAADDAELRTSAIPAFQQVRAPEATGERKRVALTI
jgi:hypothetical protein